MFLEPLLRPLSRFASFTQIVLLLPLTLDHLGPSSFLLCSLLLAFHQFTYSTLRLALKNTPLAPLVGLMSLGNPFVPGVCALITLYLHLHPPTTSAASSFLSFNTTKSLLTITLPKWYAMILRTVSPLFTLLEGFATLLCAQLIGRLSKGFVEDADDREEGIEWRRLGALVASAGLYCAGIYWLIKCYPLTSPDHSLLPTLLLGAALASLFFLTLIGFARRRATVVETALVWLYVVYSGWMSGKEADLEPRNFPSTWLTTSTTTLPISLPVNPLLSLLKLLTFFIGNFLGVDVHRWLGWSAEGLGLGGMGGGWVSGWREGVWGLVGGGWGSIWKIASSLPPTTLISLTFRLLVLHLASRIIPAIRRASAGWEGSEPTSDNGGYGEGREGFWDGRKLGDEMPSTRVTLILLSYRRAILIAVYTHLLLLDNGSQVWWRWVNIYLFMTVWALELLFDSGEDEDAESIKGWKVE